jgi:hypothetical protein
LPSERFVVPSIDAVTPEPALGLPLVVTGGHSVAHAPKQVLLGPVSFSNR